MAFTVLLIVLVVIAVVASAGAWLARCRSRDTAGTPAVSPHLEDPWAIVTAIREADTRDEHAEAVLTAWLLAGRLSAEDYRRDMASLAARDARRHPLVTPPDR